MTDKKTQAIIARLASDHDGEVVAAARVLQRMAAAKGLKLWEFLTTHEPKPPERKTSGNYGAAGNADFYSKAYTKEYQADAFRRAKEWANKTHRAYEEAQKAKQKAKQKEAEEAYENMKRKAANPFQEAYYDLRKVWATEKSNWFELRDDLAQAVVRKGSDHLTTWEKEFLLDLFHRPNLSPTQRQKAEQILKDRF